MYYLFMRSFLLPLTIGRCPVSVGVFCLYWLCQSVKSNMSMWPQSQGDPYAETSTVQNLVLRVLTEVGEGPRHTLLRREQPGG